MNDKDTVVVPREATPEMIWAYHDCPYEGAEDKWSAMLAAAPSTSVRDEVEYEVWQDDAFGDGEAMVAGSTNLADAQHYAAVYSQDGPAWVVEVTRRHLRDDAAPTDLPPLQDTGERDGGLSR